MTGCALLPLSTPVRFGYPTGPSGSPVGESYPYEQIRTVLMQQPIEVQVDEHEQIVERVVGIDVAKASGMVCLRVPHETIPGKRVTKVWPV